MSIANLTANTYLNISNTSVVGYVFKDNQGNKIFKNIEQTYQEVIDKAILSISQGKKDFYSEMRDTLKQLGQSGLVEYQSGRTRRLDSAVRQNMLDGIRQLNQETSLRFGQEYGANMVEVSHHKNSAPDHIDTVDGKQFAIISVIKEQIQNGIEKEIKIQDIKDDKVKVKGKWYKDFDSVNNSLERKVGTLNCRHKTFNGILGVSKPEYSDKQIKEDKRKNLEGFDFEGKHYTLYERYSIM